MTSWLRKYCNLILQRVFAAALVCVCIESSQPAENVCSLASVSSCNECLDLGPQCAWCFQEGFLDGASPSERCDTVVNLAMKGCRSEFIEHAVVKVDVNATVQNTQVFPRDVRVQLRSGREASVLVQVRQLDLYPVDMYYLVDVSASMQSNLDRLKTVGTALSHEMRAHTSDFRVGFGSFVDKPVSPYINVHPSKIDNPCSDFQMQCRPTHGFNHVLSLTENMTEFTRVIQHQRISGNMDTPEGGFDAMMQAVVCQKDIGWRSEARRLLLVMTDQPSHLALDSKLAGIVVPHDGKCHLEPSGYTQTAKMEYPTVGQLAEKLLENSVYSIFAVEHGQYKWYEDLVPFLPGAYLGRLQSKASNLKELVVQAYKKLLSDVQVEVGVQDQQAHRFRVDVTPICPDGSTAVGTHTCSHVQANQTVLFNITVSMTACPSEEEEEEVLIHVRPVGFNESTTLRVRASCQCQCGSRSRSGCQDEPRDALCGDPSPAMDCRLGGSGPVCSGRGVCVCGRCVCERSALGAVHGTHCQLDNFSCPYLHGVVCGGRGQCVLGECVCREGWAGEGCECPVSTESCVSGDGRLCSGRGRCVCGRCECDDPRRSGRFCERCPTCDNSCRSHWNCVDCHLSSGFSEGRSERCNRTCSPTVDYVHGLPDAPSEAVTLCLFPSGDLCHYRFHMDSAQLHISRYPECLSSQRYYPTFIRVFLFTVLLGVLLLVLVKFLLIRRILTLGDSPVYDMKRKDSSYLPTANEKTITYRRDEPLEMHIQVHKMPLNEAWQ